MVSYLKLHMHGSAQIRQLSITILEIWYEINFSSLIQDSELSVRTEKKKKKKKNKIKEEPATELLHASLEQDQCEVPANGANCAIQPIVDVFQQSQEVNVANIHV